MSSISLSPPRTLADAIPGGLVRDIALVIGGAGLVGICAQLMIPLSFTPVPLSMQTFAVFLTVAALGSKRGLISMALYTLVGVAGFGWFSEGQSGWAFASFGYIVGFMLSAVVVGRLAERGGDRTPLRAAGVMALGNLAIYAVGVPWLMVFLGVGLGKGLALGLIPFLLGDALKIAAAAGVLPVTWKLLNARRGE